ncbi:cutinase family protein [Rhodococcus sp. NPDC058521]|uniref:cutinase family protein n=1 Tax=Rhodococcus sp. NPDC058521 TaxID=3346536 RepID=UPI003658EA0B
MSWSGRGTRKKRGGLLRKLVIALALFLVFVLVAIVLWYILAGRGTKITPTPPGPERPSAQPASCPDVQVVSVPGTWESASSDDPYAPSANPASLMLNITQPLQARFDQSRADVYTVPYVAQFSNPVAIPPDGQESYNNSRGEGTAAATDLLTRRHQECPLTNYLLVGFSQGAVIAGDIAASIGAGDGPVPADQVLGVGLIADGRRDPAAATNVGQPVAGVGAELSLAGLKVPGISMTGPREGGFGALGDRTVEICAPSDGICDAPPGAFKPGNWLASASRLLEYFNNPVHAMYNSYVVDESGTTATQWIANWAGEKIEAAPTPPHE